jgi:uncharacterized protein YeaO (DUF488 family)
LIIKIERIYSDQAENNNDGFRILVDRLWPRGLRKEDVRVDLWLKDIAPSALLRKWFSHEENKWNEFKTKYFKELEKNNESVSIILGKASRDSITLLYGTKNEKYNNAIALKEYLEQKLK